MPYEQIGGDLCVTFAHDSERSFGVNVHPNMMVVMVANKTTGDYLLLTYGGVSQDQEGFAGPATRKAFEQFLAMAGDKEAIILGGRDERPTVEKITDLLLQDRVTIADVKCPYSGIAHIDSKTATVDISAAGPQPFGSAEPTSPSCLPAIEKIRQFTREIMREPYPLTGDPASPSWSVSKQIERVNSSLDYFQAFIATGEDVAILKNAYSKAQPLSRSLLSADIMDFHVAMSEYGFGLQSVYDAVAQLAAVENVSPRENSDVTLLVGRTKEIYARLNHIAQQEGFGSIIADTQRKLDAIRNMGGRKLST